MHIKIWGCRGSLTSPGKHTLKYGGESTCIELTSGAGKKIIIDAGSGIRRLGNRIIEDGDPLELTLLITHAHWDHLAGFPFFKPAYFSKFSIAVCGGPTARDSVFGYLMQQMQPPYFPVDMSVLKADFSSGCTCGEGLCGNNITGTEPSLLCSAIPLSHPGGGYGYKFENNGNSFVFLTDNELGYTHPGGLDYKGYTDACKGADLLIHDAQYTDGEYRKTRTWGHSTYKDTLDLAIDAGVKRLGLFHHDPDRTDRQLDRIVERCRKYLLKKGSSIECFACADDMEFIV